MRGEENFPPRPKHDRTIAPLVDSLAAVVEGRSAIYVSSPLTTGERAFEWHVQNASPPVSASRLQRNFARDVVEPNREEAARYVRQLRRATPGVVVIDPTALRDIPGWRQDDYRALWAEVIGRYAETVVLRDGWQYSSGCAYEFLVAYTTGAEVVREDLSSLPIQEGIRLVGEAIEETRRQGASAEFLRRVRESLEARDNEAQ
jgi:hypothetical protein